MISYITKYALEKVIAFKLHRIAQISNNRYWARDLFLAKRIFRSAQNEHYVYSYANNKVRHIFDFNPFERSFLHCQSESIDDNNDNEVEKILALLNEHYDLLDDFSLLQEMEMEAL